MGRMSRGRWFAVASTAAVVAVVGYVELAPARSAIPPSSVRVLNSPHIDVPPIDSLPEAPFILFRDGSPGPSFGRLAVAALSTDQPTRSVAPLSCERVHYAAGSGICLVSNENRLPVRHEAFIFDRSFTRHQTIG
jgi:hypothetical protein